MNSLIIINTPLWTLTEYSVTRVYSPGHDIVLHTYFVDIIVSFLSPVVYISGKTIFGGRKIEIHRTRENKTYKLFIKRMRTFLYIVATAAVRNNRDFDVTGESWVA